MGFQDYISETEAAGLTGVTAQTLSRFAEAGYLQVEVDSDGMRLYSKTELRDVFGLTQQRVEPRGAPQPAPAPSAPAPSPVSASSTTIEAPPSPRTMSTGTTGTTVTIAEEMTTFEVHAAEVRQVELQPAQAPQDPPVSRPHPTIHQQLTAHPEEVELVRDELRTLKSVVKLQEKLLDMREAEIADLKEQRNWLKSRIERLEEKGDRDQLLLLSETQVIRRLVQHEQRRSPLRLALEWLNIIPPVSSTPSTIEVTPQERRTDTAASAA